MFDLSEVGPVNKKDNFQEIIGKQLLRSQKVTSNEVGKPPFTCSHIVPVTPTSGSRPTAGS